MELKKQLILIPPMSEPLKKLSEVLAGISEEENIEISSIENSKELSQFVGSAGQSLLITSNAKFIALFLQENKALILKNNTKVILLTPKEIPAKTLIKFNKLGLTEAILESSPPKTLLYKVKLLLKSIKVKNNNNDEKEKVVKSMLDTNNSGSNEKLKIEEAEEKNEEISDDGENLYQRKKINSEENAIDYSEGKGKKTYQDEEIATHWKSKRDRQENEAPDDLGYGKKKDDTENEAIDMFYRGKRKNINPEITEEVENTNEIEEELEEVQKERKLKKLYNVEEDENEPKKKSIKSELELTDSEKEMFIERDSEDSERQNKEKNISLDLIDSEKNEKEIEQEDELDEDGKDHHSDSNNFIDKYLRSKDKGKLNLEDNDELPEIKNEKKEYDNSEVDMLKKSKEVDLDLVESDDLIDKKDSTNEDETDHKKNTTLDLIEVDKDKDYNDEEDDVESTTDKKKKNESLNISEENLTTSLTKNTESEEEKERGKSTDLKLLDGADLDNDNEEDLDSEINDIYKHDSEKLKLLDEATSRDIDKINSNEDDINFIKKSSKLNIEEAKDEREKQNKVEDEKNQNSRTSNAELELVDENGNSVNNKADKIDTYYRSREAKKKENQDWDLGKSDKNTKLDLIKSKKHDDILLGKQKNELGEVTIDYRKLKEEFEQLSNGESGNFNSISYNNGINGDKDLGEDKFRVIEAKSVSLDFSIEILNFIYQKDVKPNEILQAISLEIKNRFNGVTVFYHYKAFEKKHIEAYNSFLQLPNENVGPELKDFWEKHKSTESYFLEYYQKSMPTWLCREIVENGKPWEDVELPTWADKELKDKKVELIYPLFDGLDRMGLVMVFFNNGIDHNEEKSIELCIELSRGIFLDNIQRIAEIINTSNSEKSPIETKEEKKGFLNNITSLFGSKKVS